MARFRRAARCAVLLLLVVHLACDTPASEIFATASVEGAHGMADGIAFARFQREQGKVAPETNLKRARIARVVVQAHITSINLALDAGSDGVEAKALSAQVDAVIKEAERLESDARADLVKTQNGALIDFGAGILLRRARSESSRLANTPGLHIVVTPKAREDLKEARRLAEENLKALDEAIKQIEELRG